MKFSQFIGTEYESLILPAIPPNAEISPHSSIDPKQCGKIPGRLTASGWTGLSKWSEHITTAADLTAWDAYQRANMSANCKDQLVGLDVDSENEEFTEITLFVFAMFIGANHPKRIRSNSGRILLVCRGDVRKRALKFINELTGEIVGIDILGNGSQFIIWGEHPSGGRYEWPNGTLDDYMFDDLVLVDNDMIDRIINELIKQASAKGWVIQSGVGTVVHGDFQIDVKDYEPRDEHIALPKLKSVIPTDIYQLILKGVEKGRRSEAQASVISNLVALGLDDNSIADIFFNPAHGIGEKAREQGVEWTMRDIARMRGKFRPSNDVETKQSEVSVESVVELSEDLLEGRIKCLEKDAKIAEIEAICVDLAKLRNQPVINRLVRLIKKQTGTSLKDINEIVSAHLPKKADGEDVSDNPAHEVTHHQLALRHLQTVGNLGVQEICCGGSLYRLGDDFVWQMRPVAKVVVEMCQSMDGMDNFSRRSDYGSVQKQYLDIIANEEFFANRPHGIAYEDSYFYSVNVDTLTGTKKLSCVPLEGKHCVTSKGRFAPDGSKKPRKIFKFLIKALNNGDLKGQVRQLREVYAMVLLGHLNYMQLCSFFFGAPATGKSVLNELLCAPFAKESVVSIQPYLLTQEYYAIQLKDAVVNQITELESDKVWGEAFKSFVDLSLVTGRHPSGRPVSFVSFAAFFINANSLPQFKDKTEAMIRRLAFFEFLNVIPVEERNPHLINELIEELPYFMYWCLEVADEVLARGYVQLSKTCIRLQGVAQERSNNVLDFLADVDVIEKNDHMVIPIKTVYEIYKGRCKSNGIKPYGKNNFVGILSDHAEVARSFHREKNPNGNLCLRGYALSPTAFQDCGISNLSLPNQFSLIMSVG